MAHIQAKGDCKISLINSHSKKTYPIFIIFVPYLSRTKEAPNYFPSSTGQYLSQILITK